MNTLGKPGVFKLFLGKSIKNKKMSNNWRSYFIILAIASGIALWLSIDGCNKGRQNEKDFETLMNMHMRDSTELVEKTNKLGQITVTAEAFQLSQDNLDKYLAENAELKNKLVNAYHHVTSINTTATNLHIDTLRIPVPIHDTLPCGDIEKNYPVVDPNKYYSFDFKFKNKAGHEPEFLFLNFNIPDTTTEVIGIKKSGFLNLKHTLVSEQTHTNKYIQIKGVKTIVKSEAKPKTLQKIAIGFGLGIIATIATEIKLNNIKK